MTRTVDNWWQITVQLGDGVRQPAGGCRGSSERRCDRCPTHLRRQEGLDNRADAFRHCAGETDRPAVDEHNDSLGCHGCHCEDQLLLLSGQRGACSILPFSFYRGVYPHHQHGRLVGRCSHSCGKIIFAAACDSCNRATAGCKMDRAACPVNHSLQPL